jgi:flagellar biosynthesis GTPase FlhF
MRQRATSSNNFEEEAGTSSEGSSSVASSEEDEVRAASSTPVRSKSKDRTYAFIEEDKGAEASKNPETQKRNNKTRRKKGSQKKERAHEINPESLGLPSGAVLSDRTYTLVTDIDSFARRTQDLRLSSQSEEMAEEELAAKEEWTKRQQAQKKKLEGEPEHDHFVRILMLGDSGVGKTSLMTRFAEDKFAATLMSTAGYVFALYLFASFNCITVSVYGLQG